MKKLRKGFREESGSVMIITAGALMIIIMFMALAVDLGMYYSNYRKLKSAADFADEEVKQLLPYFAYANDYEYEFRKSLFEAVDNMGYPPETVVEYKIKRTTTKPLYWAISVSTEVKLQTEYECIFLGIIGINKFPITVQSKRSQNMPIEQPYYDGMPYEVWGG